jgi:hypothetical protein
MPLANTIEQRATKIESSADRAAIDRAAMHLIMPVWGVSHVTTFLDLVLPLYLTPGNIPAAAGEREVRLRIYTRECDTELFMRSATFIRARESSVIDFVYMDDKIEVPHTTMSWCHRDALRFAAEHDAVTVLLTADTIFADTTLLRLGQLSDEGKTAVLVAGPRVIEEEMLEELGRHWRQGGEVDMTPGAFTALCLRHLHPISLSHAWNGSGSFNTHPSHLYWDIENEGFLAHCFHLHPMMIRPRAEEVDFKSTIDDDYMIAAGFTSDETYIVSDCRELAVFSITGRHIVIGNDRPLTASAAYVAYWATFFVQPYHRGLARTPIYFYTQKTSPMWRRHEEAAQQALDDVDRLLTDGNVLLFLRRPDLFLDKVLLNQRTLSFHPMRDVLRRQVDDPASARQWHGAVVRTLWGKGVSLFASAFLDWLRSGHYVLSLKRAIYPAYVDVIRLYPKIYRVVFGQPPAVRLCHRRWLLLNGYASVLRKAAASAVGRIAVVYDRAADPAAIEYLSTLIRNRAQDGSYPTRLMREDGMIGGTPDRYDSIVYVETRGGDLHQDLRRVVGALAPGGRIYKIAVGDEDGVGLPTVDGDLNGLTVEVEDRIGGRASRAVLHGLSRASALLRRSGRLQPLYGLAIGPFGALLIPLLNCLARLVDASAPPPADPLVRYLVLSNAERPREDRRGSIAIPASAASRRRAFCYFAGR